MWLPLAHSQLGTWPATQACALTGNRTGDPLVCKPALNPLSHTSQGAKNTFNAHHIIRCSSKRKKMCLPSTYTCLFQRRDLADLKLPKRQFIQNILNWHADINYKLYPQMKVDPKYLLKWYISIYPHASEFYKLRIILNQQGWFSVLPYGIWIYYILILLSIQKYSNTQAWLEKHMQSLHWFKSIYCKTVIYFCPKLALVMMPHCWNLRQQIFFTSFIYIFPVNLLKKNDMLWLRTWKRWILQ